MTYTNRYVIALNVAHNLECEHITRLLDYLNDTYGADMVYRSGMITATFTSRNAYAALLLVTEGRLLPTIPSGQNGSFTWSCQSAQWVTLVPVGSAIKHLWADEIAGIMRDLNPTLVRYCNTHGLAVDTCSVVVDDHDITGILIGPGSGADPTLALSIKSDFSECYGSRMWPPPDPINDAYTHYLDSIIGMCTYNVSACMRVHTARRITDMRMPNVLLQANHIHLYDDMIAAVDRCVTEVQMIASAISNTLKRISAIDAEIDAYTTDQDPCANYTYACRFVSGHRRVSRYSVVDMEYRVVNGAVVPHVVSISVDKKRFSHDGIRSLKQLFLSV